MGMLKVKKSARATYLRWMELGCQVLLGQFETVYLLQVSKNEDEESCF